MIYLIKSGSYSDVGIHGYFTNEEDAYEYCELVKQKYLSSPAGAWHLDLYVEPVPEMQVEFPKERLAMLYEYSVIFSQQIDEESDKLTWQCDGALGPTAHPENGNIPFGERYEIKRNVFVDKVLVHVALDHPNPNKAMKIAQDYFAQLRAEGKIDG